jgi:hypothetical protein
MGGVIQLSDNSNFTAKFLTIKNNIALFAGVFRMNSGSLIISFNDSIIEQNQAIYSESIGQLLEMRIANFNRVKFIKNSIMDPELEL